MKSYNGQTVTVGRWKEVQRSIMTFTLHLIKAAAQRLTHVSLLLSVSQRAFLLFFGQSGSSPTATRVCPHTTSVHNTYLSIRLSIRYQNTQMLVQLKPVSCRQRQREPIFLQFGLKKIEYRGRFSSNRGLNPPRS